MDGHAARLPTPRSQQIQSAGEIQPRDSAIAARARVGLDSVAVPISTTEAAAGECTRRLPTSYEYRLVRLSLAGSAVVCYGRIRITGFGERAMHRKLTITLEEAVYEGLHRTIGKRRISQFIEDLVRPHVVDTA